MTLATFSRLTVVTGTWNRLSLLQRMIASARAAFPLGGLDFVVVDAGSTDGTIEWCAQQQDVTLIQHGERRGAIRAFNDGCAVARGEYVTLANDDIEFLPDSLLRGYTFLEDNPAAGAVAFLDNRRVPHGRIEFGDGFGVQLIQPENGDPVPYAQVGMYRRWLGDLCGWWGRDDTEFLKTAFTYGGDNYLSTRIWELGYTVEIVHACRIRDFVHNDDLRTANLSRELNAPSPYYQRFPKWTKADTPLIPPRGDAAMRVLYMPVYEAGYLHLQKRTKYGLRAALERAGCAVLEVDYVNTDFDLPALMRAFRPDLLLTQVHGIDRLTTAHIQAARAASPDTLIINWIGDVWRRCYLENGMAEYHAACDLALGVNADALAEVETLTGTPGRYWQNAFEYAEDKPLSEEHALLFLGSFYKGREALGEYLENFGAAVSGAGWQFPTAGNTTYNFQAARDFYRSSKLTISDNVHRARGFVSDRIWSALAAGGALLLQEHVDGLDALTGLQAGVHYVEYDGTDDLREKVTHWLDPKRDKKRRKIAADAAAYVRECHSFDARVRELWEIVGGLT